MITLKPHQILQFLGFDIPEEGITHSPDDSFLLHSLLKMAGNSITFNNTPEIEITALIRTLRTFRQNTIAQDPNFTEEDIARHKSIITSTFKLTFKHQLNETTKSS